MRAAYSYLNMNLETYARRGRRRRLRELKRKDQVHTIK